MHDLYVYPQSLPDGWIGDLIDIVKNPSGTTTAQKAHFAWHCAGFGLRTLLPDDAVSGLSALAAMPEAKEFTAEQAVEKLEKLKGEGFKASSDPRGLPWNLILPVVIFIIKKLLGI